MRETFRAPSEVFQLPLQPIFSIFKMHLAAMACVKCATLPAALS